MTITVAELTVLIVTASVRMMVNHRKFCSSASSQEERNNETVTTPLAEVSCSSSSFLSKSEANFVSPQPRDCHRYFLVPEAIHCQQFGAGGYTICRCSFNTWISGPVIPRWQRLKVSEFVSKMKIGLAPVGLYLQSKDQATAHWPTFYPSDETTETCFLFLWELLKNIHVYGTQQHDMYSSAHK